MTISDPNLLRGLANWLAMRPQALSIGPKGEAVGTSAVANDLRRIADELGSVSGSSRETDLRLRLEAAERERAAAYRARDQHVIRCAALEGELERAYAAFGRDYLERLRLGEAE